MYMYVLLCIWRIMAMLHRTTILLPPILKSRAAKAAAEKGVSFGELVRIALELHLSKKQAVTSNPFFDDHKFYEGDVPADISQHHDNYLYDEE